MATYFDDFSGDTSAWTRVTGTGTAEIVSDVSYPFGKAFRLVSGGASSNFLYTPPGDVADQEVLVLADTPSIGAGSVLLQVMARHQNAGAIACYVMFVTSASDPNGTNLAFYGGLVDNNGTAGLVLPGINYTPGDIWWFRLRVSGTGRSYKVWKWGTEEPANWNISNDTTSPTYSSGYGALRLSGVVPAKFYYFSMGTNGDTAPGPAQTLSASLFNNSQSYYTPKTRFHTHPLLFENISEVYDIESATIYNILRPQLINTEEFYYPTVKSNYNLFQS
jgi:hypothetical protein